MTIRIAIVCFALGTVIGACSNCPEENSGHLELPIREGRYRIEPTVSLPEASVDLTAETATFELINPDGLRTRVTYRAGPKTWSDDRAR